MSSSTFRAISNPGFLLCSNTRLEKSLEKGAQQSWLALNDWEFEATQLASTETLPNMREAPWRQSPSGGGDTVLVLRSSPSTKNSRNQEASPKMSKPSESAKAALTDYNMPRDRNCNKFKADLCKPVNRDFLVPRQFSWAIGNTALQQCRPSAAGSCGDITFSLTAGSHWLTT